MAIFSATWSASDRPVFPYNSVIEALIEVPQAPKLLITQFMLIML